ncbi:MAG: DUF4330 family protein [Lachnospiraceae bacterium]|nr:DUF4330 family protein [Lachnospiraceae bacterium]
MNETTVFRAKKRRFNVIDLLIVLVLLAVIGTTVIRAVTKAAENKRSLPELKSAEISFLIEGLDAAGTDYIVIGDTVRLGDDAVGTVKSFDIQRASLLSENGEGKAVTVYSDTAFDIRGVISAEGCTEESGFLLNGTLPLAPGQVLSVRGTDISFTLLVTDISRLS